MQNLIFEAISKSHSEDLKYIWGDKEVIRYTNIKNICSLEEIRQKISLFKEHDVFVIKYGNQVVGIVGCPCINKELSEYGVFYQLRKEFWNKGIATKAMKWILNYMKEKYFHLVMYADVVEDNMASDKILNKFGFDYIFTEKGAFQRDEKKMNIRHYKLIM